MSFLLFLFPSLRRLANPPTTYVCSSGTNESCVLLLVGQQSKEGTSKGKKDIETWYPLDRHAD